MKTIPLLHDHHTHPLFYSAFRRAIDFSNVTELEHACSLIRDASTCGQIVLGHGWKDNFFAFDDDLIEKLPACAIFNISLHNLAINSAASSLLADKIGNEIRRLNDRDWYERNLQTVLNWFALLNGSVSGLIDFYGYLEATGIASAEEMLLVDPIEIDWFKEAGLVERTKFWADPSTYQKMDNQHKCLVSGIKLFTDGAFGARTAAISQSYVGEDDNYGMLVCSDSELSKTIDDNSSRGLEIAVHAIGDRAIEQVISAVETINTSEKYSKFRIEHAQSISVDQAKRAKQCGMVLSMQPNFNIDSVNYSDRLPQKFLQGNNPFRMLIDEVGFVPGQDLVFGSDGMPHGIQFAIDQSLNPPVEMQRLTLEELIAGYGGGVGGTFEVSV